MYQGISSCKREIIKMISRSAVFMAAMLIFFILGYKNCLPVKAEDYGLTGDREITQDELDAILLPEDVGGINTNGYTLTITEDAYFGGNLHIGEGGKVIVKGDMSTRCQVMIDTNGSLIVEGNYEQMDSGFGDFAANANVSIGGNISFTGTGHPNKTGFEATVTVGGDFIYDSTSAENDNLCKWIVNGNVIQKEKENGGQLYIHKLAMKGEGEKTLQLQENGNIGELSLENGMTLDVPQNFSGKIMSDISIRTGEETVFTSIYIDKNLNVTVDGNMIADVEYGVYIDEGATLKVTGDYTQKRGGFGWIHDDVAVDVGGDFKFIGTGHANDTWAATVTVGGDLIYDSTSECKSNFCTWKVGGSVIQKEKDNIGALDLNKLIMTGEGEKTLLLQDSGRIGELSLKNGAVLNAPKYFTTKLKSDMTITTGEETVFTSLYIEKGLNVTVSGNVIADVEYGVYIDEGATFKVTGDYTQKRGGFGWIHNDVAVEVGGDFKFTGTGHANDTWAATVTVGGDLIYDSTSECKSNFCTWKVGGSVIQKEKDNIGALNINKLVMQTEDSKVLIEKGKVSLLTLAYGKSHYTIEPDTCYEKLIATSAVTLDANGGKVDPAVAAATTEKTYGSLPVPVLDGKEFAGWYTAKDDGDVITATTVVTAVDDHTLYAHWKDKAEEGQPDTDPEPTPTPEPEKPDTETEVTVLYNKVSKINNADVGIEVIISYPKAVTWTGKKITKGQLAVLSKDGTIATVKISGLENAISSLKTDVDLGKLIMPTYVIGSEKKVNSKGSFYVKLGLNSGVAKKAGIKGKDKTALSKIIKELNKELKAKSCSFDIVPIELKDAVSVNIKANIKSGELVLNDDGSIKGLKSVKIKVRIPGIEKEKIYSFTAKKALKTFKISVTDKAAKQATLEALEGQNFKGSYSGIEITK